MNNLQEHSMPKDMQEALNRFEEESQKVLEAFLAPMSNKEPPEIIYHYTNDAGLRGILETGKLWLTDIFNLNDPSELQHGLLLASQILNQRTDSSSEGVKAFIKHFEKFGKLGANTEEANYFVCSFSAHGNDLGQWRAYADNGRGYALGFSTKLLEKAFIDNGSEDPSNPGLHPQFVDSKADQRFLKTFRITYEDAQLTKIDAEIIDLMSNLIELPAKKRLLRPTLVSYFAGLLTTLVVRVLEAGLHFKHEAYSNEQEYRFLEVHRKMTPDQVKVRSRPYSLVKYREFDWKKTNSGALKEIVVGPAADPQRGLQFAKDCRKMFSSTSVEITQSRIPYRAF